MRVVSAEIPDVKIVIPDVHRDERGYFSEIYNRQCYRQHGINVDFVQDNESCSSRGVLRGLHWQAGSYAQAKLVRVIRGAVWDVAVDIRKSSPTFGKYVACELTAENAWQFFVPRGFAHGFLVLSDIAEFCYKCDDFYHPNDEGGIAWNDPDLGIDWKVPSDKIILSEKDTKHPQLKDADWLFDYYENLY
jgi:dTDP-4-dehydrorhamnose 3,5-epimerase